MATRGISPNSKHLPSHCIPPNDPPRQWGKSISFSYVHSLPSPLHRYTQRSFPIDMKIYIKNLILFLLVSTSSVPCLVFLSLLSVMNRLYVFTTPHHPTQASCFQALPVLDDCQNPWWIPLCKIQWPLLISPPLLIFLADYPLLNMPPLTPMTLCSPCSRLTFSTLRFPSDFRFLHLPKGVTFLGLLCSPGSSWNSTGCFPSYQLPPSLLSWAPPRTLATAF